MKSYRMTIRACFIGYIVQAIVNNFAPLLFVMFNTAYHIPLNMITLLVTVNFLVQLGVDAASILFIDRIGWRASAILAHVFSSAGLLVMALCPTSYPVLLTAVVLYAIGGGLIEVLISPIMENCPTENKEKAMSLLHSFYCWGHVGVVLLSTAFFAVIGIGNWKYLAIMWSLIPLFNILLFAQVPIPSLTAEGENPGRLGDLLFNKMFWLLIVMMITSGASEQSVSQWASTFAEKALHINKTMGDLTGTMMFAVMMGLSRAIFGKYGEKLELKRYFLGSTVLCICSYLLISVVDNPIINLAGCALCGLSVGIFWPGTISNASVIKPSSTALYALLALAGDVGCSLGPTVTGLVSSLHDDNLKTGILAAAVFPVILLISFYIHTRTTDSK